MIEKIKIEIGEHFDDEEEEEMVEKENSQEIKKQKEKEIYSQECLCKFDEILKKKVIGKKPLKMTEFRYVYEELNEFIKDCFDKRYRCVEKTM